jgi:hypothetical protein
MHMTQRHSTTLLMTLAAALLATMVGRAGAPEGEAADVRAARAKRGEYMVNTRACNDCHTPWRIGPNGPEADMSRALSGHPSDMALPPAPGPTGPWVMHAAGTNTAWAGPWGVSFTANLTPDRETGIGDWTEEMFIATVRTARHQGKGRAILPPMPIQILQAATDEDLKDIFAYLQSLPAIRNKVPTPIEAE